MKKWVRLKVLNTNALIKTDLDRKKKQLAEDIEAGVLNLEAYGNVDGDAHTLKVNDLSDNGVKTSIRFYNNVPIRAVFDEDANVFKIYISSKLLLKVSNKYFCNNI